MRALILVAAAVGAGPAVADEAELQLGATVALEAATIRHPLAGATSADFLTTPISIVPRVGLGARYGVTNELQLGLGIDAGGAANVATDGVTVGGTEARLITGGYFELAAPLTLGWRVDSGYDLSAAALIELAPMFAVWSATAPTDPAKLSDDGLARRLPFDIADALNPGIHARVQLAFDARVFGAICIRLGAYAGATWAGSASLRAGVILEPSFIVPPGPL